MRKDPIARSWPIRIIYSPAFAISRFRCHPNNDARVSPMTASPLSPDVYRRTLLASLIHQTTDDANLPRLADGAAADALRGLRSHGR